MKKITLLPLATAIAFATSAQAANVATETTIRLNNMPLVHTIDDWHTSRLISCDNGYVNSIIGCNGSGNQVHAVSERAQYIYRQHLPMALIDTFTSAQSLPSSKGWQYNEADQGQSILTQDKCNAVERYNENYFRGQVEWDASVSTVAVNYALHWDNSNYIPASPQQARCYTQITGTPTSGLQAFMGNTDGNYVGVAAITTDGGIQVTTKDGSLLSLDFHGEQALVPGSLISGPGQSVFAVTVGQGVAHITENAGQLEINYLSWWGEVNAASLAYSEAANRLYLVDTNNDIKSVSFVGEQMIENNISHVAAIATVKEFYQGGIVATESGAVVMDLDGRMFVVEGNSLVAVFHELNDHELIPATLTHGGKINGRELVYAISTENKLFSCFVDDQSCKQVSTWTGDAAKNSLIGWHDRVFGITADSAAENAEGVIFNTYHSGNGNLGFAPLTTTYKNSVAGSLAKGATSIFSLSADGTLMESYWTASSGWLQTIHHYGQTDDESTHLLPGSLIVDDKNVVYGITKSGKQISVNTGSQRCFNLDSWNGNLANLTQVDCYSYDAYRSSFTTRVNAFNKDNVVLKVDIHKFNETDFKMVDGLKLTGYNGNMPIIERSNWQSNNHVTDEFWLKLDAWTPKQGAVKFGDKVKIASLNYDSCIYSGPETSNNAKSWYCNNGSAFTWKVVEDGGAMSFESNAYGNCLLAGQSGRLHFHDDCQEELSMRFKLHARGDAYQIENVERGQCLVIDERIDNDIRFEDCSTADNQLFRLTKVK